MDSKIIESVAGKFPDWKGVILIKSLEEYDVAASPGSPFEYPVDEKYDLKHISTLVIVRYSIENFHEIVNGLHATINVFEDYFMLVTKINDKNFVVFVPKNNDLGKTYSDFVEVSKKIEILEKVISI